MFGFTKKNAKAIEVHRTLGRIENRTFSATAAMAADAYANQRQESRNRRLLPVLFSLVAETEEVLVDSLQSGITQDLSSEGFGLLTPRALPGRDLIVAMAADDDLALLLCECRHSRHLGYNYWLSGIQTHEVLPSSSFPLLVEAIHALRRREQQLY